MAAKPDGGEHFLQLRNEVEKLRERDTKLKSQEVICQKAKEWFLSKKSKSMKVLSEEKTSVFELPDECKSDVQFSEIQGVLTDIQKEQKRLLMLKYQLREAQKEQEVGLINDILLKQSGFLQNTQVHPKNKPPLAVWFSEITQSIAKNSAENPKEDQCSKRSQLFYNVHYRDGTSQLPQDLLAQTIYRKKIKHGLKKEDFFQEVLQFSTCHRGYCVWIKITNYQGNSQYVENNDSAEKFNPSSYHIDTDIHLNGLKEHLVEFLAAKKSPEDFVRICVWKEIEELPR